MKQIMNKKAQTDKGIGIIIVFAVAAIVAMILFQVISQQVGDVTTTGRLDNSTFTAAAVNETILITGKKVVGGVSTVIAINTSGNGSIDKPFGIEDISSNFTFIDNTVINGNLGIGMQTADKSAFAGQEVNLSYSLEPVGFISESSARNIANLIVILTAIATLGVAIFYLFKSGMADIIKT